MEKIEPTRIERSSFAELSLAELVRLAEETEWLILQVPATVRVGEDRKRDDETLAARAELVQSLTPQLPEHTVWDAGFLPDEASQPVAREGVRGANLTGVARVGIRRVVTERTLEAHQEALIAAVREYQALTNSLMRRLAEHLQLDLSTFADELKSQWDWPSGQFGDRILDGQWKYSFHGQDCAFIELTTGVTVEARLGYGEVCGEDFAVFDPGFFGWFVRSTLPHRADYVGISEALRGWYPNACLALEFLETRGILRRIPSESFPGWIVASSEETNPEHCQPSQEG